MFDFMKLPTELRLKIYGYALVRDVIRIISIIHPFGPVHPDKWVQRQVIYEEPNRKRSVTLRSRYTFLKNKKFVAGNLVGDEIYWSYGIQPSHAPPLVNIFLTNRQVYSEAWPIFYQKNAFAFTIPDLPYDSAANCIRFLYDRPYHALRHIREIHLLVSSKAPWLPLCHELKSEPWQILLDVSSRLGSIPPRENRRRSWTPVAGSALEKVAM